MVAPPYDVIDTALQQKLYDASPYNAIRLELTRTEPGEESENKYARAATTLREWLAANVLRQDTARGLYVYEQEYSVDGQMFARRGFMARVRLEPFGKGKVFPHEQTMSGPKEDRLKLVPRPPGSTSLPSSVCTRTARAACSRPWSRSFAAAAAGREGSPRSDQPTVVCVTDSAAMSKVIKARWDRNRFISRMATTATRRE